MQNIFNSKDLLYFLIRGNLATPSSKNIALALAVFNLLHFVTNPNAYFGFKWCLILMRSEIFTLINNTLLWCMFSCIAVFVGGIF